MLDGHPAAREVARLFDGVSDDQLSAPSPSNCGVTMPAEVTGVVALDEIVLHGWDLARATGQDFRCDPVSTEAVLGFTARSAEPEQASSREGLFGPVVAVPPDASAFDRALGFAGRDPAWTP